MIASINSEKVEQIAAYAGNLFLPTIYISANYGGKIE